MFSWTHSRSPLVVVLRLLALHSAAVGIGLLAAPSSWLLAMGLDPGDHRFFAMQGGVFHLILASAYAMASARTDDARPLVLLTIVAKSAAAVFLVSFYALIHRNGVVLASGVVDAAMALAVILCDRRRRAAQPPRVGPSPGRAS